MVCTLRFYEKPQLTDAILIEGLPGIGLVAHIAVSHLIRKLNARLFGEVHSPSFQNVAITDERGTFRYPVGQLYYHKGRTTDERDLILLYGNTQALTTRGQYELCGCILDAVEELGCQFFITLGGYRPEREVVEPRLYYAASDLEAARTAANLGAEVLKGRIFGVAGLLVGLGRLRGMKGFCLLAETPGTHPDREAAREALRAISKVLGLSIDLNDISSDTVDDTLMSFDIPAWPGKKPIGETAPQWFI